MRLRVFLTRGGCGAGRGLRCRAGAGSAHRAVGGLPHTHAWEFDPRPPLRSCGRVPLTNRAMLA